MRNFCFFSQKLQKKRHTNLGRKRDIGQHLLVISMEPILRHQQKLEYGRGFRNQQIHQDYVIMNHIWKENNRF